MNGGTFLIDFRHLPTRFLRDGDLLQDSKQIGLLFVVHKILRFCPPAASVSRAQNMFDKNFYLYIIIPNKLIMYS